MSHDEVFDLPFDQYQRYRITAEIIQVIKKERRTGQLKMLDVGGCASDRERTGYVLPLSLFFPEEDVTVVDLVEFKDVIYVKGNGKKTIFASHAFDIVVCNDVLEHIRPSDRKEFIENLIRVSKAYVILASPYKTKLNELAENYLSRFIQERLGEVHVQLKEHIDFGLPRKEEIEDILKENGVTFFSFPSGNIYRWFLMMIIKHYVTGLPESDPLHRTIDRIYNQNFWNEVGVPQAYRSFFIILKGAPEPRAIIDHIQKGIYPPEGEKFKNTPPGDQETVFQPILDLVWTYHPMIESFAIRFHEITKRLDEIQKQHGQLQEFYRALDASSIYKTYRFLKKITGIKGFW